MSLKINYKIHNYAKKLSFLDDDVFSHLGIGDFAYSTEEKKLDPAVSKYFIPFFLPPKPVKYSYKPARYFAKGIWENDPSRYPAEIQYLLSESTEEELVLRCPKIKEKLTNLPLKGTLRKTPYGLVYLDVDDQIVHKLYPLMPEKTDKPPYFSLFNPPRGAHSPVIIPTEVKRRHIDSYRLVGQEIDFTVSDLALIEPNSWKEVDKAYILIIESKDLEGVREAERLSPRIGGNDFHIVIAIKETKNKNIRKKFPSMRINSAYYFV